MINYSNLYNDTKPEKELFFELGRTLIAQSKFRKAIEFLEEAKSLDGTPGIDWEIFYLLGDGYRSLSRTKDAFENYIEASIRVKEEADKPHIFEQARGLVNLTSANDIKGFVKKRLEIADLSADDTVALNLIISHALTFTENGGTASISKELNQQQIQQTISEIQELISKRDYNAAILKIEPALSRHPDNYEILFLKLRILIEGQIDFAGAAALFSDEDFGYRKEYDDTEIISRLNKILEADPANGNAFYFAAFIGHLMAYDKNVIAGWLEKATSLGLKTDNEFSSLGLYLLKGGIGEEEDSKLLAAANFLEAAKCYYWKGSYTEAEAWLKKTIQLDLNLDQAYKYYADVLFILSSQSDPPYNNETLINKAYDAWQSSPEKTVRSKYDAWHYIVIARIHEIKFKFRSTGFYEEYWLAALYAERALVQNETDYSLWSYQGMFYRDLNMEINSLVCFEKGEALNNAESFLTEEKVILQLNTADFEKPSEYLEKLKTDEAAEGLPANTKYKPYHRSWEGYILFHSNEFESAAGLYEEIIKEDSTNLFAYQMKMLCYWQNMDFDKAKSAASEITALRNRYDYLKEEFSIAWSCFIQGEAGEAINILEQYNNHAGTAATSDNSYSLCQFYLYTGQLEKANASFDSFIQWTYNKRILRELSQSLAVIELLIKKNKPELYILVEKYFDADNGWQRKINMKLESLLVHPVNEWDELKSKQAENNFEEGSVPFITMQACLARLQRNKKNLPGAYRIYNSLAKNSTLFPEAQVTLEQIDNEIFTEPTSNIRISKYDEAINDLEQFDLQDTDIDCKKNILLSLAYYGINNKEKSLEHLTALFRLIENNIDLQKQFWSELTDKAYNSALTWEFGNFLQTNIQQADLPGINILKEGMAENFWNVLINKGTDLYPVVTPIAIEISSDLVPAEASNNDWYVIKDLIPAMRERVFQKYGVRTAPVRIRANEGDMTAGTYIIMLDEIPLVMGTAQKGKLFVTKTEKDLQTLAVAGDTGWNPVNGQESVWVDTKFKEILKANNISFWEDPFDYIIAHLESVLVTHLEMFIDTQFCDEYLTNNTSNANEPSGIIFEKAKIIREDQSLLLLFNQALKALVRERVAIVNKQVIIQSFIEAKEICPDINDLVQYIRIALKKELTFNTQKIERIELPAETEQKIKKELQTEHGKTFLAMTPENCQEALSDIRDVIGKDPLRDSLVLVAKDPRLRIHLRKLVELEFPNLLVASEEELIEN